MRLLEKALWTSCLMSLGVSSAFSMDSNEFNKKISECNQMVRESKLQKALELSGQLIKQDKSSRGAQICKGKSELALDQYAQAIETFKIVNQLSSTAMDKMMAQALLGNAYKANKQVTEALASYKNALETAKSIKNQGLERVSHELVASALFLANNYDQAMSEYQVALKLAQNDGERADLYERLAECYEKQSDMDSAINYQIKASLAHTKYSDQDKQANAQLELGRLYFEAKLFDQSAVAIEKVVAMAKDNSQYWESKSYLYLAKVKLATNKSYDAKSLLDAADKINQELKDKDLAELADSLSRQLPK